MDDAPLSAAEEAERCGNVTSNRFCAGRQRYADQWARDSSDGHKFPIQLSLCVACDEEHRQDIQATFGSGRGFCPRVRRGLG